MKINTKEFKHCDMVSIEGRVDSSSAPQLSKALDAVIGKAFTRSLWI